jgi:hypothetical protein
MSQLKDINTLADTLHIHYRTALTEVKRLQMKYPDNDKYPELHRYVGKRIRFTDNDIDKIINLLSKK